jgi:hypothetical protein
MSSSNGSIGISFGFELTGFGEATWTVVVARVAYANVKEV